MRFKSEICVSRIGSRQFSNICSHKDFGECDSPRSREMRDSQNLYQKTYFRGDADSRPAGRNDSLAVGTIRLGRHT